MSAHDRTLTTRQYTDIMLAIGADHVTAAAGPDAVLLALIPVLWMIGVVAFIALKHRSR